MGTFTLGAGYDAVSRDDLDTILRVPLGCGMVMVSDHWGDVLWAELWEGLQEGLWEVLWLGLRQWCLQGEWLEQHL